MTGLVWLRNDLRLRDNPALYHAAAHREGVVALYIVCDEQVQRHAIAPARLDFVRRQLSILKEKLSHLKIHLHVERVRSLDAIAPTVFKVCQDYKVSHVHFNAEYPLDEVRRDEAVNTLLQQHNIRVRHYHDRVILPPGCIRNKQNAPYKVFTAFKRQWLELSIRSSLSLLPLPQRQPQWVQNDAETPLIENAFQELELRDLGEIWPAGEDEALERLDGFVEDHLDKYHTQRDTPAVPGTSQLSPYLALGALSPRQCLATVLPVNHGEWTSGSPGAVSWLNELIWRDFYQHVVVDFPEVCRYRPMQTRTDAFPWRRDEECFHTWCRGETGIPIVDAAMKQLRETGWMHNRLRMVTAMFFTKNLQMDWRLGERYFMSQLVDGDFAANNGGWQWCASTGSDAAPYFRVFNPVSQSRRFDPDGTFIRQYLPALTGLANKQIHEPPPTDGYPPPVVDLKESRREVIEMFRALP